MNPIARGLHTIRRAGHIPPRRWWAFIRTVGLTTYLEVALRYAPLPRVARSLRVPLAGSDRYPAAPCFPSLTGGEREAIDTIRRVLALGVFNGTCLRQSLLIGHALRARGPVLRLGVKKVEGTVRAHAWVEIGNNAIDEFRVVPLDHTDFRILELSPATTPGGRK